MELKGPFDFADYYHQKQSARAPTAAAAPSEDGTEATAKNDHIYEYVPMREADPAQDAVPIGYALYPQYAFAHASQQAPPQMVYQKEEHVRAHVSRAKSPKPATAQPNMMYPVPEGYTAVPYAYTMPNYPVPVHASTAGRSADDEDEVPAAEKPSKVWVGRTKKQVDEDNVKIAVNEGIYGFNEIMPKNARPDQLFWVIELDGTNTLRTFRSIDNGHLGKGIWKVDPRHGNAYFVLAKEEVKFEKDKKRRKSR